mmetsp:Transcript_1340/g.3450  ORF Transcript_1340/g.3450 Transcript_1340/m.3450 type:complete len:1063 (-) Transcript_1340:359-3547(-)
MAVEKTRVSGRARLPLLIALLGVQSGAAFSAAFPSPSLAAAARASSSAGLSRPLAAFPQRRAGGVRLSSLDDDADASTNADSLLATASAMAELAASSGGGALTQIDVCDEMQTSYLSYAMSVILSRALPDVRDGLKPVQRRILYAMDELSITPTGRYRKCARVVGEVLGKFHPHGDSSVYEALVRMAQPFNLRSVLIDGHGNFGSNDPDPPAAMRYTECRLSPLAYETLLAETSEATVPFADNFDTSEREPKVLPAKMPMLLLNGAVGIAVGMATSIPPHNPTELADAVIALLLRPDLPDSELFDIVKAPDFPTAGEILGLDGVRSLYATGQGVIKLRGKVITEKLRSSRGSGGQERTGLVVSELPYAVTKSAFILKLADLVQTGKMAGIAEIRDESDRDGMRVVVELKREANPALVTNHLLKATPLQSSFAGNLLALTEEGRQPMRLTLRQALVSFIEYRKQTTRARATDERVKALTRLHIAEGLRVALMNIDAVVAALRAAQSTEEARAALCAGSDDGTGVTRPGTPLLKGGLSSEQADAILAMPLRRLTGLELRKLETEVGTLTEQICTLDTLLADPDVLTRMMVEEQKGLRAKFGSERRTRISQSARELEEADLIQNERCVVLMTARGYVKRMPLSEFGAQRRGTRGKAAFVSTQRGGDGAGAGDAVVALFGCNQHDVVLMITERGIVHSRRAYQIPSSSRTAQGTPLHQLLPIEPTERVQGFLAVPADEMKGLTQMRASVSAADTDASDTGDADTGDADTGDVDNDNSGGDALLLITRGGFIKKTPLKAFVRMQSRGLIAITLGEGDELLRALRCPGGAAGGVRARASVVVASAKANCIRFSIEDDALRPTGRSSRGVRAMLLRPEDELVDADLLSDEWDDETGYSLTRDENADDETETDDEAEAVIDEPIPAKAAETDETETDETSGSYVLAVTAGGYGKRVPTSAFRVQKRGGRGVICLKFKKGATAAAGGLDRLVALRECSASDEVLLSTAKGTAVRQAVGKISEQGRTATGVLIQRLDAGDSVASVAVLPRREDDEEEEAESEGEDEEIEESD